LTNIYSVDNYRERESPKTGSSRQVKSIQTNSNTIQTMTVKA